MRPNEPAEPTVAAASHQPSRSAGAIVRTARQASGLTLAELGQRCGYSASQISRYERGIQPLTDITLLRRFASALEIPPQILGLTPMNGTHLQQHAQPKDLAASRRGPSVNRGFPSESGDDPVRRRELLARAAGLAGAAALGIPAIGRAQLLADPRTGLDDLLYGRTGAAPAALPAVHAAITQARARFQAARYEQLTATLPRLIATAAATRDSTVGDERAAASTLLANAYIIAANFVTKLNDDPFAWALADRALQAAQAGNDPLTAADGRRVVATVLRRTGRPAQARDLLISAAHDIEPGSHASADQLAAYGTLLETAAYTAAVDGDRRTAAELIGEAESAAVRFCRDACRSTAFGPTHVALYQVSIAQVLGDNGTAIEHAKTIRAAAIPTPERQGPLLDRRRPCLLPVGQTRELLPSPTGRRTCRTRRSPLRPPVHRIAEDLLRADRRQSLPGLPAFVRRIGVPAA
jgi:transcriptional regulator with XRE-family HTH domain